MGERTIKGTLYEGGRNGLKSDYERSGTKKEKKNSHPAFV